MSRKAFYGASTSRYGGLDEREEIDIMPIQIKEEVVNDDPEIVMSNKGGPKLIHKGFMYTLHKKQPNSMRWRCVLRTYHCRGSLMTNLECKTPFVRMSHSHPPDYEAAELARRRYKAFGEPLTPLLQEDGTLNTSLINKTATIPIMSDPLGNEERTPANGRASGSSQRRAAQHSGWHPMCCQMKS